MQIYMSRGEGVHEDVDRVSERSVPTIGDGETARNRTEAVSDLVSMVKAETVTLG